MDGEKKYGKNCNSLCNYCNYCCYLSIATSVPVIIYFFLVNYLKSFYIESYRYGDAQR